MRSEKWGIILIFLILALVKLDCLGFAYDDSNSRPTLRGLQGVYVTVKELDPEIEKHGLNRHTLQTDIELKLRMAGIKVISLAESRRIPGRPFLYLSHDFTKGTYSIAYHVNLELIQQVSLIRIPSIEAIVPTWSVGHYGTTNFSNLGEIRNAVKDQMDMFRNAYLSVNSK